MIINWEKARSITGDDPELYKDLWTMIPESMDEKMEGIHQALAEGDLKAVEFAVHKLKGALRNVAAEDACAFLQQMEDAARNGDLAKVKADLPGIPPVVDQVVAYYEKAVVKKEFSGG